MLKKHYTKIFIIVFIAISVLAYFVYNKPINEISPKVLVIYKSGTENYLDTFQNFNQSYILNTEVNSMNENSFKSANLSAYDLVYPDSSLITCSNINEIKTKLISYVEQGGCLFLENQWHKVFPKDFTGVISYIPHTKNKFNFTYPTADYNLQQLQLVVKNFLDNFIEYRKDDFKFLQFNKGILNKNAKSLVSIDKYSIMSVNKYKNGYVLMCSNLMPNNKFITGFDLRAKNPQQAYFDYSLATLNYLIRNEFLAFSIKEKYGLVFKKVFGPYGRPAMAWQNHYEALSSIKDKEMIKWIDLLKEYNQIPSISLVRSAFDWGKWQSSITVHLNNGTNEKPLFLGEYEDSYYSSGKRITTNSDYLTFGEYPEYKSLKDEITQPHRAYPSVVDFDNDGDKDLIVGAPDGILYFVENVGSPANPVFEGKQPLKLHNGQICSVGSFAAPYIHDINKDGLFDLIVGNGEGDINIFINNGSIGSPKFLDPYKLQTKVSGVSAPAIKDINNDGFDDLIIGNSTGSVELYKGDSNKFIYTGKIINNSSKYSAPAIYDWNNDGYNDILLGDNSGTIKIYINNGKTFNFEKTIEGRTYNMYGSKDLLGGHNSVPLVTDWNNDGIQDLIVGQLEFGIPYDIDGKFFKYKNELNEILGYALNYGIPVYPHFYTHKYKTPEQESRELELHKKAFHVYKLDWNGGIDQHTWQTNNNNPQQTFKSEIASGIWWNFGFNPPNQPDLPRDGKEFLWSTPFLLTENKKINNFVVFTPSPNLFKYPNVYSSFSNLDMPVTYFEHIEYRFSNPSKLDELKQIANFLNQVRSKGEYNFMTQEQMAKSFINTFFSKAYIKIKGNKIIISPNLNEVPILAGEYKGTLGIKLEKGKKYINTNFSVTSPIYFEKNNNLYFGLNGKTKILFDKINDNFHIVRSNVPIKIYRIVGTTYIEFLSKGMQEIKIYSANKINIEGEEVKVQQNKNFYTVTHYGNPITIKISKK